MFRTYLSETKQTAKLALPFTFNLLLQMSVVTIDSLMAGRDGELTLAAVAQGAALWDLTVILLIGILMPMAARVARAKNNPGQLRTLFQQALWLAALLAVLATLLMWWMPTLMSLIGVNEAIIAPATAYLQITAFSMPFIAFYLPIRFFHEGLARPHIIVIITATSIPINIMGNWILLNGLFGFPKMGAAGVAWATLCAEISICVLGWGYLLRSSYLAPYQLLRNFTRPLREVLWRYLQLGIPSAIALLMEVGMFTMVILLSGRLGVQEAAANQIAFNYGTNTFMIPLGISMALTTRIGMAMSDNHVQKARIIGVSGILMGAFVMSLSILFILFFGQSIATFYTAEPAIIALAGSLLTLAAVMQVFDGIQVCAGGALRGLEETKAPMRYAILGYWVLGVPLGVLFAFGLAWNGRGLWVGLIVGLATTAILGVRKFLHMMKHPTAT